MENGGNMFISFHSNCSRGQSQTSNNNNGNLAWDNRWALDHSRLDSVNGSSLYTTTAETPTNNTTQPEASTDHAVMFPHTLQSQHHRHLSLYAGNGSHLAPDPHLMCLKLGKRHYFEDTCPPGDRIVGGFSVVKKGKPYYNLGSVGPSSPPAVLGSTATVPRCQVEGCHVALVNAKDYHRRHKVCEIHSKAPKVMVLGLEQRFCQQCSRFHVVSEFDDSKRSCRRRLAGHNERRRKSSHDSVARNSSQVNKLMAGRFPYVSASTGRALSLLSSKADSSLSSSDLSSRCSAALRELIAENRATVLSRHLILDREYWHLHHTMEEIGEAQYAGSSTLVSHQYQMLTQPHHSWGRYQEADAHVTLDLMQAPSGEFGFLSVRDKTKEEEEECTDLWNSLEGAHVV